MSRNGITWTLGGEVVHGVFVTGDPWVRGACTVLSVSPAPTGSGGSHRNGSMLNVRGYETLQGHDGRTDFGGGLSVSYPVSLTPGDVLVSTESEPNPEQNTPTPYFGTSSKSYLRRHALLTCVDETPIDSAFRPGYAGPKNARIWESTGQLDTSLLPGFPATSSMAAKVPSMLNAIKFGNIDHPYSNWRRRYMRPWMDSEDYGREIGRLASDVALTLSSNVAHASKTALLYAYIQLGIDQYSLAIDGAQWHADNGHMLGRQLPIVFAGLLFDHPGMRTVAMTTAFAENEHTYEAQGWTGTRSLWRAFTSRNHEERNPAQWTGTDLNDEGYRLNTSPTFVGQALAAEVLGLATDWGHWTFFEYAERWATPMDAAERAAIIAAGESPPTSPNYGTAIAAECWALLRDSANPNVAHLQSASAAGHRLVMLQPPVFGASYWFAFYNAPQATGVLLMGPQLGTPVTLGNGTFWVSTSSPYASVGLARNTYGFAGVSASLPAGLAEVVSPTFQAAWLTPTEECSDGYVKGAVQ